MEKMAELEKRVNILEEGVQQLLIGLNRAIQAGAPGAVSNPALFRALDSLSRDLAEISRKLAL